MSIVCILVAAKISLQGRDSSGWGIGAFVAAFFDLAVLALIITGGPTV